VKRFATRSGFPRKILSENESTFKEAAKFIDNVVRNETVWQYLSSMRCQWMFDVEYATWLGGVFERMVRSTRHCLQKVIGTAHFARDEMFTAVTKVKGIISSRPLSYISLL